MTFNCTVLPAALPLGTRQYTVVGASHCVDEHREIPTNTVLLGSVAPKLVPVRVSKAAPDSGAFAGSPDVSTGASKVKTERSV